MTVHVLHPAACQQLPWTRATWLLVGVWSSRCRQKRLSVCAHAPRTAVLPPPAKSLIHCIAGKRSDQASATRCKHRKWPGVADHFLSADPQDTCWWGRKVLRRLLTPCCQWIPAPRKHHIWPRGQDSFQQPFHSLKRSTAPWTVKH